MNALTLQNIHLDRPLVFLDLETTGADPKTDRIVEISCVRFRPGFEGFDKMRYILNPGISISPEASAVHGYTNHAVQMLPTFAEVAQYIRCFIDDYDLAGYNLKRFDLRILCREFMRVNVPFSIEGRRIIDVMQIYHQQEKRDLSAAVQFYLGADHDGAHGALADAVATAAVLDAQVSRYGLTPTVDALGAACDRGEVDIDGCFVKEDGAITFAFGKHRGRKLDDVARTDPGYLEWVLRQEFLPDTKRIAEEACALTYAG